MSFKRDGDDFSQLNILKKRRVAELFAHHIPDDEALLMSNGRYACTVCHYRPVFDTLQMLTIHRQGKKHQKCLEMHYKKKRDYMQLVEKRRHEDYMKNEVEGSNKEEACQEDPLPLLTRTCEKTKNVLLKATPYNSCVKWGRPKTDSNVEQKTSSTSLFFASTRNEHLKKKTETEQYNALTTSESLKVQSSTQNERLQETRETEQYDITIPKTSKGPQLPSVKAFKRHVVPSKFARIECGAPNNLMPYISKSKRRKAQHKNSSNNEYICEPIIEIKSNQLDNHSNLLEVDLQLSINEDHKVNNTSEKYFSRLQDPEPNLNSCSLKSKPASKKLTETKDRVTQEKEIKRILQLTSSGWKRDRGGVWVKDEDVEFDSDEEEPSA